jgi:hypothetical protein
VLADAEPLEGHEVLASQRPTEETHAQFVAVEVGRVALASLDRLGVKDLGVHVHHRSDFDPATRGQLVAIELELEEAGAGALEAALPERGGEFAEIVELTALDRDLLDAADLFARGRIEDLCG